MVSSVIGNAMPVLSAKEREDLEKERANLIDQQKHKLMAIIKDNQNDPDKLYKDISQNLKEYKPDALELALNEMQQDKKGSFYEEATIAVKKLWHTKMIGGVKLNRSMLAAGNKPGGITEGGLFTKESKSLTDKNLLKQSKVILLKKGSNQGEEVCEYLATNLANSMMGSQLSPKFRLHKDEQGEIKAASTFIKGFETLSSIEKDSKKMEQAEGFARYFAVNAMLSDPDYHDQNAGITTLKNGKSYLTRIDHGKAFVFIGGDIGNKVEDLKKKMINDIYHNGKYTEFYEKRLYSPNFANELKEAANDINEGVFRHVIQSSMKNLREAYGEDFLEKDGIAQEIKNRFGLDKEVKLNEKLVEDIIVNKSLSIKKQLEEMAARYGAYQEIEASIVKNDLPGLKALEDKSPGSLDVFIEKSIKTNNLDALQKLAKQAPENFNAFINKRMSSRNDEADLVQYLVTNVPESLDAVIGEAIKESAASSPKNLNKKLIEYLVEDLPGSCDHFISKAIEEKDIVSLKHLQEKGAIGSFLEETIHKGDKKLLGDLNKLFPEAIESFSRSQVSRINESDSPEPLELLKKLEHLKESKINGDSLLKHALKEKKMAAIKMIKSGFTLAENEVTPEQRKTILESNSLRQSIFGGKHYTPNDKLREAIIGSATKEAAERVDLSKKPSPLFLAMQTGQHDLALELAGSGQTLKRSELALYASEQGKVSRLKAYLSFNLSEKSIKIAEALKNQNSPNIHSSINLQENAATKARNSRSR